MTSIGVAGIIGTGIFVLTGQSAAQYAGPAIVIAFVLAGFISAFAAFCYAEFASIVSVAGSAYTYAYATLGELFAWVVGWALVLEYAFGAATVGVGWSGYLNDVIKSTTGHALPMAWITPTRAILAGIPVGASVIFFAYIGFDVLTTPATPSQEFSKTAFRAADAMRRASACEPGSRLCSAESA